jgi:hypothetical protein
MLLRARKMDLWYAGACTQVALCSRALDNLIGQSYWILVYRVPYFGGQPFQNGEVRAVSGDGHDATHSAVGGTEGGRGETRGIAKTARYWFLTAIFHDID